MNPTLSILRLSLVLGLGVVLTGCGNDSAPVEEASAVDSAGDSKLASVFVDSAPEGAITVLEARKSPEPGKAITIVGRVAGAKAPFSDDFATLVVADDSLETCERIPGDSCRTPWDACCVEPQTISASRLLVQVLGEDGQLVDETLKGVHGLTELDEVVVQGTVAEGSNADNLIINASSIHKSNS